MRAVYLERGFESDEVITLSGVDAHHLINVVRVKVGDTILLLDGVGKKGIAQIDNCTKRDLSLTCKSVEKIKRADTRFSVGIGKLKKDAMDDVLKSSCELGVETIYILTTERSQKYELNLKRAKKILISGIEQSNHPYLPELIELNLNELEWDKYANTYLFTLIDDAEITESKPLPENKKNLIIIGPEGGFSKNDLEVFPNIVRSSAIQLNFPILRAPTAFNCALGYLQAYC